MRRIFLFLMAFLPLTSMASAESVSYNQVVSINDQQVATLSVSSKGFLMRSESNFRDVRLVMLRNKQGTFSYYPAQNIASKIPGNLDRPNVTNLIPRFQKYLEETQGQIIGQETIDGNECDIYTFVEPVLQAEGKVWMWKEKSFPLKIEIDAKEGKTTIKINNVDFDTSLEDTHFDVPADTKILDLAPLASAE